jgi:cytoskeletal protein RodZ
MPYDDCRTARATFASTSKAVGSFGDKFRQAREAKGISLDDVSNVTKISTRMLQAIEQEHFDQLPGGVFNKGFIRAYAKHLGLNDEDAITSYLACLRQAQIDAQQQIWQPQPTPSPAPARPGVAGKSQAEKNQPEKRQPQPYTKPAMTAEPPIRIEPVHAEPSPAQPFPTKPLEAPSETKEELPHLQLPRAEDVRPPRRDYASAWTSDVPWNVVAAVAVVLLFFAFLWIRHSHSTRTEAASAPAPAMANAATPSQPPAHTPSTPPATQPSIAPAAKSPVSVASNASPNSPPTNPPPTNPMGENSPAANSKTNKVSTASQNDDDDAGKEVVVRHFPPAKPAKPAPSFTLVIRAAENSWINITADGQSVSHENLIAPAATSVHATREIVARVGNAAGVTFLWHGQEIPAQGTESEVKTFVFDSNGMREVPTQLPAQNR